jgi:hypothetical protein
MKMKRERFFAADGEYCGSLSTAAGQSDTILSLESVMHPELPLRQAAARLALLHAGDRVPLLS